MESGAHHRGAIRSGSNLVVADIHAPGSYFFDTPTRMVAAIARMIRVAIK